MSQSILVDMRSYATHIFSVSIGVVLRIILANPLAEVAEKFGSEEVFEFTPECCVFIILQVDLLFEKGTCNIDVAILQNAFAATKLRKFR